SGRSLATRSFVNGAGHGPSGDLGHLALDPRLRALVDHARLDAARLDRWPDHDPDRAAALEPAAARPELAGVVCDGNDRPTRLGREQRSAETVALRLADRHPRALWEDHHP